MSQPLHLHSWGGIDVDFDGQRLYLRATSRAGRFSLTDAATAGEAIRGGHRPAMADTLEVPVADIETVRFKKANLLQNGHVIVKVAGRTSDIHLSFTLKWAAGFTQLAHSLGA